MYVSDSQRIERLLIPHIMLGVVQFGATDRHAPESIICTGYLVGASAEAVEGVPDRKRASLIKRMLRLHEDLLGPYKKEGARVDKVGLLTYYVLKAITDSGYMQLVKDSNMDRALNIILPALEPAANIERLDASAQKASRRMLKQLQEQGYFRGVIMEDCNG